MKKVIIIVTIVLMIFLIILNINNKENKNEIKDNKISIILETEEGNIETSTFPSKEDYIYEKVMCENTNNTVTPTFNSETWKLNLSVEEKEIDGDFQCDIYFMEKKEYNFNYTGSSQTFTVPYDGIYKIELWGASSLLASDFQAESVKRKGAYTSGNIILSKNEILYVYVGEQGKQGSRKMGSGETTNTARTYNGGGAGGTAGGPLTKDGNTYYYLHGSSGGGATDIRFVGGSWDDEVSLRSRIMVASGASGTDEAGGLEGYARRGVVEGYEDKVGVKATQVSGYGFGIGEDGDDSISSGCHGQAGAGGGYYGGGGAKNSGAQCYIHSSSSGSSYISGHTGCVAITSESDETPKTGCATGTTNNSCSIHYSGKTFSNTVMIDGLGYSWTNTKGSLQSMPNPSGGYYSSGNGHTGNGYARITLIELN